MQLGVIEVRLMVMSFRCHDKMQNVDVMVGRAVGKNVSSVVDDRPDLVDLVAFLERIADGTPLLSAYNIVGEGGQDISPVPFTTMADFLTITQVARPFARPALFPLISH